MMPRPTFPRMLVLFITLLLGVMFLPAGRAPVVQAVVAAGTQADRDNDGVPDTGEDLNGDTVTLYVDSYRTICTGAFFSFPCLRVKEGASGAWGGFSSNIISFTYAAGYAYELRVSKEDISDPGCTDDCPDYRWTLIEEVSKLLALSADGDNDFDGVDDVAEERNGNGNPYDDDTDSDGTPDFLDADDDGDGVMTGPDRFDQGPIPFPPPHEDFNQDGDSTNDDADSDGTPNYRDADDDNDGVATIAEDANGDGDPTNDMNGGALLPDYLNPDYPEVSNIVEATLFVDSYRTVCAGAFFSFPCLRVKEGAGGVWGGFSSNIISFTYQAGYAYELRVSKEDISDPGCTDDCPHYRWTLIEEVSKLLALSADGDNDFDRVDDVAEDRNANGNPYDDDTDSDGTPDFLDADDDGDGIATNNEDANGDGHPNNDDSDGDGIADYLDADSLSNGLDSDDDGLPDATEGDGDLDGDGIPNFLDPDDDNDGRPNHLDSDDDGDGVADEEENGGQAVIRRIQGFAATAGSLIDSDGDGLPNSLDLDSDNDSIPDAVEAYDADGDGRPDILPLGIDRDGDGMDDAYDVDQGGTAAFLPDADNDGTPDYLDNDDDGDGTPTLLELGDSDGDTIPAYLDANEVGLGGGQPGIAFRLSLNAGVYEVYMRPTGNPAPPNLTLTAQVTIKASHTTGLDRFVVNGLTNTVANTAWTQSSRTDAPSEDVNADYISFGIQFPTNDNGAFHWQAGQAVKVFTFRNAGRCLGPVELIADSDPFTVLPNSAGVNPGNQIDVLGLGAGNAYIGNYDTGMADCLTDDTDGDSVPDIVEDRNGDGDFGNNDSDGDGKPDYLDTDDDNDGLPTRTEDPNGNGDPTDDDSDNDGTPNYLDPDGGLKRLPIMVMLRGPYDAASGLMRDTLRAAALIPTSDPYGGNATAAAGIFAVTGADAIIDWVWVELRGVGALSDTVVAGQAALVQADGDVVATDGSSALTFDAVNGTLFHVAVRHRNHLGVMTAAPVTLSPTTPTVDFTQSVTPVYGAHARQLVNGVALLWPGNANGDSTVISAGPQNDVNIILTDVLSASGNYNLNVNYILFGYRRSDVNLDGRTIAAGPSNDVNIVLTSVFVHPGNSATAANFIVQQQLP